MNNNLLPHRSDYLESIDGLRRLHALSAQGLNDSDEADAIRDDLDYPWYRLTDVERKRIRGLSADLYSISDPPVVPKEKNPQAQQKLIEAYQAKEQGDWDRALELLRQWSMYIDPSLVSYFRGSIWLGLGDLPTATLFFEHAAKLNPENEIYVCIFLSILSKSDSSHADIVARSLLENYEAHHPLIITRACDIRFSAITKEAHLVSQHNLHKLIPILVNTLERLSILQKENQDDSTYQTAMDLVAILLGLAYQLSGNIELSLQSYNAGLSNNPTCDTLLIARGILRYGDSVDAHRDFLQAVEFGTSLPWPYLFLAHHYFMTRSFGECLKMCQHALALEFPMSDLMRGDLHEWMAIARAELGYAPDQVRSEFEEAIRYCPDDELIRRNLHAFEQSLTLPQGNSPSWENLAPSQLKSMIKGEYLSHISTMFPPIAA